jgi:outer membrane lipoprotein-sorting protein
MGPRLVAAELRPAQGAAPITVGYEAFAPDGLPRRVHLQQAGRTGPLSLQLSMSQVEVGAELEDSVFRVTVPPDFATATLEQLRQSSPLAQR